MHQIAKRGLALLMALIMCIGLLPVMNLRADAAEIEYVYDSTGKYIYNWGSRGETATSLSPKAEEFYTNTTYTELSQLSGGTSTSDAPDSALYSALQKLMKDAHTYVNAYSAANNLFQYTDCQNSGTDSKEISSFYSGNAIGPAWDSGATWNKEHTWPNSKGDKAGSGEDDIMMLRPTAKDENGSRGNKAYGESSGYYYPNTESNDKLDVRGDVARIVLYTYVRWGCINTGSSYNPNDIVGTAGVIESLKVLLDWIEADPVDTWELGRNDAVQQITGTRNVFVDYPELAFLLFGADMPANMPTPSGEAKNADTCQHNYVAGTPVAPTCTEEGYTVYTCSLCSKSYKGDKTPATGHTYVDGTCTGCGKTEPTSNAVLIYYPTDQKYVTGEEYLYNNKKYELVLSADKADALKLIKIENEDGTVTFATAGGQYLMADGTNVRLVTAEGDNTKFVLETATNGYYIKCANATYNGKAQYLEVYGGYLTCFGFDSSKANIYTFQLEAVDGEVEICQHPNTEIIPGKDATCGEPGLTEGKKCTDCGATLTAQQEIPATGEHTYVGGICTGCGKEEPTGTEATITFDDKSKRTEYSTTIQVWEENGITVTNEKGASTTNVGDYADPARFYQGSSLKIEFPGMTKIVFNCNNYKDTYAGALKDSIGNVSGVTVTVNGTVVTVEFAQAQDSLAIAKMTAQARVDSITVYAAGGETPEPECQHTNTTVEGAVPATCTTDGHTGKTVCVDCGVTTDEGEAIPATGHNYVGGTCTNCGETESTNPGGETAYVKITSLEQLVSGQYVMIVSTGYAPGVVDGTWITAVQPVVDGDKVTDPQGGIWTLTVEGTTVTLMDSNGVYIAPKGGNNNGLKTNEYSWDVAFADGLFQFRGTGDDTVALASNTDSQYGNKFRGYKTTTITDAAKYPSQFTLYKLTEIGETPEPECQHTNTTVEGAVPATCTTDGHTGKTVCVDCGVITDEGEAIPATGHNYVGGVCTGCGKEESAEPEQPVDGLTPGVGYKITANNADGALWYIGTVTGGRFDGSANEADAVLVYVEVVDGGYLLYQMNGTAKSYINMDDKSAGASLSANAATATVYVWDANLKTLVVADPDNARAFGCQDTSTYSNFSCYAVSNTTGYNWGQYIPAAGETPEPECQHTNTTVEGAVPATCTTDGHTGKTVCVDCRETLDEGETIPATGHTEEPVPGKDATCTEAGLTDGVKCSVCGVVLKEQKEIPATGHDYEAVVTEPTCNLIGYTTHTCAGCGDSYVTDEVRPTGHLEENREEKPYVAPTQTEAGYTAGVYCNGCGTYLYGHEQIPALGYTVRFIVPATVTAVAPITGTTVVLPTAEAPDGFAFVGWVTEPVKNSQEQPAVYTAGETFSVDDDDVLYALYSYETAETTAIMQTSGENSVYQLVTDATQLVVGKNIVIVAAKENYAMSTTQNSNNRASVAIVKNADNTVTWTTAVQVFQLVAGSKADTYGFYTGSGYLYAASSSKNYLRTQNSLDANASWTITVTSAGVATVKAQGSNSRNWMRFNTSNIPKLFACYSSGQTDIALYIETEIAAPPSNQIVYTTVIGNECAHENTHLDGVAAATCTTDGYTGDLVCDACGGEIVSKGVAIQAQQHIWTEATCMNAKICGVCGETDGEPLAHTPGQELIENEVAADCVTDGSYDKVHYCTICGEEASRETVPDPATGHTPSEPAIENKVAPTCTADGSYDKVYYCTTCGEEASRETVPDPATGHDYQAVVTAPTCSENGYTTYTCSVCGDSYVADEVPATGAHTFGAWNVLKAATCTEGGMRTRSCVCGASQTEMIAATGVHAYSAWTETKAATCTEEGEKTRSCACGINEFAKIAALGHTEVVDAAVAATCTTAGKTEGKHCDLCNEVLTAQEEIPALGHSEVTDAGKAATCTTAGKTEGKHCSVCGEVLVEQEVIAATGHSFGDWKVSKETTRTEAGEETRSCACGEMETREIPALGGVNPVPVVIVVVAGLGAVAVVAFVFMKKKRA